jgi:hypothetical protein
MLWFCFSWSNILVFKLGGTSLSLSVMEVNSGMYRVLSTNTDDSIGGAHFTETLAQYLASEFQRWVSNFFFFFCGTGDWSQNLEHARQGAYHWATFSAPFYFKAESHSVVQAGLKLKIFLPQPPKFWDYICAPPHLTLDNSFWLRLLFKFFWWYWGLNSVSRLLGKHSPTWAMPTTFA